MLSNMKRMASKKYRKLKESRRRKMKEVEREVCRKESRNDYRQMRKGFLNKANH